MTIVTGNETFPGQNISKVDIVPDEVPMVIFHIVPYFTTSYIMEGV